MKAMYAVLTWDNLLQKEQRNPTIIKAEIKDTRRHERDHYKMINILKVLDAKCFPSWLGPG